MRKDFSNGRQLRRIIAEFDEITNEDRKIFQDYIGECCIRLKMNRLTKDELRILKDGFDFFQAGKKDIITFVDACIETGNYKTARSFILQNIENEGISDEDKKELNKVLESVLQKIRIGEARQMIRDGERDIKKIAEMTKILEIDVISLMKDELGKESILGYITSNHSTTISYVESKEGGFNGRAPGDE